MNDVYGIASDKLESFLTRIENLSEEKRVLQNDIKEVYAEAKGAGFDVKIMREIVKLRKMESADRDEMEYLLDAYKRAVNL